MPPALGMNFPLRFSVVKVESLLKLFFKESIGCEKGFRKHLQLEEERLESKYDAKKERLK
jgi:hypothetical protein